MASECEQKDVDTLLESEKRDSVNINAFMAQSRILIDAVDARDSEMVCCLAKIATYKQLVRAGVLRWAVMDDKLDRVLAAVAYRDTQIIKVYDLDAKRTKSIKQEKEKEKAVRRLVTEAEVAQLRMTDTADTSTSTTDTTGTSTSTTEDWITPTTHWEAHGKRPYLLPVPLPLQKNDLVHNCYVCRLNFPRLLCLGDWTRADGGHASVCASCALQNANAVECVQQADLTQWTIVITGCRHTVGFAAALIALRAGAVVIGTSRFPRAAYMNFQQQPDFEDFKDRLELLELDFLRRDHLDAFGTWLATHPRGSVVDAFISNAFLTVNQTPEYYASLELLENTFQRRISSSSSTSSRLGNVWFLPKLFSCDSLLVCNPRRLLLSTDTDTDTECAIVPTHASKNEYALWHPTTFIAMGEGEEETDKVIVNEHGNLAEPAGRKTLWNETVQNSSPDAILESTIVNQIAPTLLLQTVCRVMQGNARSRRVLINVTSTEHLHKTTSHAITGMHKAAMEALWFKLSRERRVEERFEACSVDPGFVTGVCGTQARKPLTSLDGGARVMHPIAFLAHSDARRPEVKARLPPDVLVFKNFGTPSPNLKPFSFCPF